jgi:hypothetical protein
MGSEEFDSDDVHREHNRRNSDEKHEFKSAFAQELNEKISKNHISEIPNSNFSNSQLDVILDKTLDFRKAQEDFLRVKQENARLRFEIEKHKYEEERYNKFQLEIEHLTCKLNKMEQTRHMYEDASDQLGYIFELFSNQLALSPYGTEVGRSDATRRRSRTIVPEDDGMSSVQNRRKSTSCTNTQERNHKYRSTSTDCASDTSSVSQAVTTRSLPRFRNRRVSKEDRFRYRARTLDTKHNRYKQEDQGGYASENVDMEQHFDEDDFEELSDAKMNPSKAGKKKSSFGQFLIRLKRFLLKENRYDFGEEKARARSNEAGQRTYTG